MKLEVKTDKKGICEYFKINNRNFGEGIYSVDIHIEGGKMPTFKLEGKLDGLELHSDDIILNDSNDLNIELIIDVENYNFIKEKSLEVFRYPARIKINNKVYNCMFYNHSIFVEPKIKLPKSISKIKIIDDLSLEDYYKIAEKDSYIITIGNKKVKYYSSGTVERNVLGNLRTDVTFIEY